jgi:hypothetical protein
MGNGNPATGVKDTKLDCVQIVVAPTLFKTTHVGGNSMITKTKHTFRVINIYNNKSAILVHIIPQITEMIIYKTSDPPVTQHCVSSSRSK